MRHPTALLLFLGTFSAGLACSREPCSEYARKLCADLGAGHPECRNAQRAAEDPTPQMREVCREALRSYDDVLRVFRRSSRTPPASPPAPEPPSTADPPPASADP